MSKGIKQGRLTIEELHQVKWLIGAVLTLLSLWALSSLGIQSEVFLLVSGLLVVVSIVHPAWMSAIPSITWRLAGPLILLVITVDFAFALTDFFPPLMRMVILLLTYRALAPRTRREDLQLILLCLFGVVVAGALTVSLLFAVQILLFTPVAMALLFVICLLDHGSEVASLTPEWKQFRWRRLLGRVWRVLDLRVLALGTVMFAFVVSFSTLLFVLIPRFNLEQAIPFLQLKSQPMSGFSDNVQLGEVSEISEDYSIALRVDVPSFEAIQSTPYWRMLVLDQYHDGSFQLSKWMQEYRQYDKVQVFVGWDQWRIPQSERKSQVWDFYFEGGVSQYLPVPGTFHSMRFSAKQDLSWIPAIHVVSLNAVQQSRFSYQIEDLQWDVRSPASDYEIDAFESVGAEADIDEASMTRYPFTQLELSMSSQDREALQRINQELMEGVVDLSASQYSQRVTSYLRQNYRYSLNPSVSSEDRDPVVSWLTTGSVGHCELFAGAFLLLAREADYPARMVVGFAGGSWNAVEEFFVVRNSDAHAWVEIYDSNTAEWLRVDPTPGASPNDPEQEAIAAFEFETGTRAWVDGLRMQWYRRVVSFDQADQMDMATSMIDLGDDLLAEMKLRVRELGKAIQEWIAQPFSRESLVRGGSLLCLCVFIFVVWRTRYWWQIVFQRILKRPKAMNPIRKRATRYLIRVKQRIILIDASDPSLDEYHKLRGALEALRFGPEVSVQAGMSVLDAAKRLLRRRVKR